MRYSLKCGGYRWANYVVGPVVVLVCIACIAAARNISKSLHVTTRLVEVNVVVHDKSGAPVSALKRGDFTIVDGRKKQQISVFSVDSSSATQSRSKPLPPDVFSNLISRSGSIPTSATVILLDGADTRFGDLAYARNQLIKFLRQLRPTDRAALYSLGDRLSVIQDFTSNPSPLIEALRHYSGAPTVADGMSAQGQGTETSSPPLSGAAGAAAARLNTGIIDLIHSPTLAWSRIYFVYGAIRAIAWHLSGLPGRKSLVWVTGSIPLPMPSELNAWPNARGGKAGRFFEAVRETIRALNEANVALYPVDARGIFTNPIYGANIRDAVNPLQPAAHIAALVNASAVDLAMSYWASETGGRAFYNTNDISGAIRDALDDSELTYTLGYYPNDVRWNGEYRHIKVLVDRKGLRVRYRHGYYATSGKAPPTKDPAALLLAATNSPLDSTGIGLRVRVDPSRNSALRRFDVTVYMDAHELTFHAEKSRYDAGFIIWAAQYSRKGDFLGATSKTVAATMDKAQYRDALAHGLPVSFQDAAKAGAWQLRVAVRDTASGAIGSVRMPLHKILGFGP